MPRPRVSVLMSVYDGGHYLRESVLSILNQTFADFEFIIVDDGSKDKTPEILEEIEMLDRRVTVLRNERNLGLTRSLNSGLRIARGEYIARQDADDISLRERLQVQVKFMDEHPEVGVAGSWVVYVDEKGEERGEWRTPAPAELVRWSLLFGNALAHASVMIRRSVLQEGIEYQPEVRYAQDYDLWSRLSNRTELSNLPEALVVRRVHGCMISAQYSELQEEAAANVMRRMMSELLQEEVPESLVSTLRRAMRDEPLSTRDDLREVSSLIMQLHRVYGVRRNTHSMQLRRIAEDAADRLARLAIRHVPYWPATAIWVMLQSLVLDRHALSRHDFLGNLLPRSWGAIAG